MGKCKHCTKDFVKYPAWKTACSDCFNTHQGYCERCKCKFYKKEDWAKVCPGCYKACLKKCEECDAQFYGPEVWRKVCVPCYKAGKGKKPTKGKGLSTKAPVKRKIVISKS